MLSVVCPEVCYSWWSVPLGELGPDVLFFHQILLFSFYLAAKICIWRMVDFLATF